MSTHVTVSIGDDMDANPTDVEIDGTKITLIAPFDPDDANADRLSSDDSDTTTITFRRSAGITLPTVHGDLRHQGLNRGNSGRNG